VEDILGVVKLDVPVPPVNTEPPLATSYQSIVSPVPAVAEMFTVPDEHTEPLVPIGADGETRTFMDAVLESVHPDPEVRV
jgi:hypothetical protein